MRCADLLRISAPTRFLKAQKRKILACAGILSRLQRVVINDMSSASGITSRDRVVASSFASGQIERVAHILLNGVTSLEVVDVDIRSKDRPPSSGRRCKQEVVESRGGSQDAVKVFQGHPHDIQTRDCEGNVEPGRKGNQQRAELKRDVRWNGAGLE